MLNDLSPIWYLLGVIFTGIFSAGGVSAWQKARNDRRSGVAKSAIDSDDAVVERWKALNEAQVVMLLHPLQQRLDDMEKELREVKESLAKQQRKYWAAISHIRNVKTWIDRNVSDDLASHQPSPPPVLTEDI